MSPPGKGGNRDDDAAPRKNRLPKISRTPARDWNFPPIRGSFSEPETTSRPSLMIPLTPSRLSTILLAALLVGSAGTMAFAADSGKTKAKTKVLGTFQDWKAFSYEENGQKVCYISSQPKKISPKGKARGDAYILVTHRPAEKSFGVVSITAGYTYKKDSEVQVKIDRNNFKLFTDGDTAWARDESSDKAVSTALKSGKSMTVKGVSSRGTKTSDSYSLSGAGPAYAAINEACGAKK